MAQVQRERAQGFYSQLCSHAAQARRPFWWEALLVASSWPCLAQRPRPSTAPPPQRIQWTLFVEWFENGGRTVAGTGVRLRRSLGRQQESFKGFLQGR